MFYMEAWLYFCDKIELVWPIWETQLFDETDLS